MKFLIFNIAVIAALFALFAGRSVSTPEAMKENNLELSKAVEMTAKIPASKEKAAPSEELVAPELPPARPVAVMEPKPVPIPERVISDVSPAIMEPATEPKPQLMTPRERRRELQRLAHNMEDMFLERLAR